MAWAASVQLMRLELLIGGAQAGLLALRKLLDLLERVLAVTSLGSIAQAVPPFRFRSLHFGKACTFVSPCLTRIAVAPAIVLLAVAHL